MLRTVMTAVGLALGLGFGATTAMAAGDVAEGEKWANRVCKACHTFEAGGRQRIGPNLWGIVGRVPGTVEGFDRYKVADLFVENGVDIWTEDLLTEYFTNTAAFRDKYAGGRPSAMVLPPLPEARAADIAAYMATLKD